jgi:hypothetical protein
MGKRSRQLHTGLDKEGRIKRSVDEKSKRQEAQKNIDARSAKAMLKIAAEIRKKQAEGMWVKVESPP